VDRGVADVGGGGAGVVGGGGRAEVVGGPVAVGGGGAFLTGFFIAGLTEADGALLSLTTLFPLLDF